MSNKFAPQFPIYIPSKSRSQYMITSKVLTELKTPHFIIVEPDQVESYQDAIKELNLLAEIIPLDLDYKKNYEVCDNYGLTKSTGPGPARNQAWDDSVKRGFAWHWVMDDNIQSFRRFNHNEKVKVSSGGMFKAMEDFCLRYTNIAMAGPNYYMFMPSRVKAPPFSMNTRIYSCNLIRNDVPFRWRGRYNEDTILSIDMLKAGLCTVQFNAFLQTKMPTQTIGGGNTQDFYHKEGTLEKGTKYAKNGTLAKSQMLCEEHPDISTLSWKFSRWHHQVDYRKFKNHKLILKPELDLDKVKHNNYGMKLSERVNAKS